MDAAREATILHALRSKRLGPTRSGAHRAIKLFRNVSSRAELESLLAQASAGVRYRLIQALQEPEVLKAWKAKGFGAVPVLPEPDPVSVSAPPPEPEPVQAPEAVIAPEPEPLMVVHEPEPEPPAVEPTLKPRAKRKAPAKPKAKARRKA